MHCFKGNIIDEAPRQ